MGFGHEKFDVCRTAIEQVGWAYRFHESPKGHRNAKDQALRFASDPDTDSDTDGNQEQADRQRLPGGDARRRASGAR